ncbi:NAD-dependent epimerase/dehydratase family protein [Enterovibrio calviensis]|uniref:NAD-dependent epimerase/dehydratase family protein n=1 Tax=Enterovibrio calviensis TaxID=91359 RepID=UPI000489138F|nr:NAD(P)-dependent oxidoreductase [Enterovibrio calviensis]
MKRVVITGASGHLGKKLFDHLKNQEGFSVIGLDIRPNEAEGIYFSDFTEYNKQWIDLLDGADVLVHLAADREPDASWESAIKNNINGTMNLYQACKESGVKRVVFASSNWLHGGYRFTDDVLRSDLCPFPVNAYGVAKLFGERVGEYFSRFGGLSVVCMRIGWTQWTHDNQPGDHMAMGRWGQEMWLSDTDFLNGMQCAIEAENIQFEVLNLMSENEGMRWDISETTNKIGYVPNDKSHPNMSFKSKFKSLVYSIFVRKIPQFLEKRLYGW